MTIPNTPKLDDPFLTLLDNLYEQKRLAEYSLRCMDLLEEVLNGGTYDSYFAKYLTAFNEIEQEDLKAKQLNSLKLLTNQQ